MQYYPTAVCYFVIKGIEKDTGIVFWEKGKQMMNLNKKCLIW